MGQSNLNSNEKNSYLKLKHCKELLKQEKIRLKILKDLIDESNGIIFTL